MVFGSITFLFYLLPVFLLLYYLVPSKWQNLVLLVGSLVFYAYGAPLFRAIFIVMMFFNWLLTRQMHISSHLKAEKMAVSHLHHPEPARARLLQIHELLH